MRTVAIDSKGEGRPHVFLPSCWCHPEQCEHGCWIHKDIDGDRFDEQPRMAVYSEQYVRGMAPESG